MDSRASIPYAAGLNITAGKGEAGAAEKRITCHRTNETKESDYFNRYD
jgi:hypothetical protein